jgi:hypothetical protein
MPASVAVALAGGGAALVVMGATPAYGLPPAVILAGLAAFGVGSFHLGGLAMPDPVAHQRARNAERALVELGLTYGTTDGSPRDTGPADEIGEPVRVEPEDIPRWAARPKREDSGPGRGTVDRVDAEADASAKLDRYRDVEDPPVGGPE